jgi:hypothetical protein
VFIDHRQDYGVAGKAGATSPLDSGYISRLAEFISDAASHGIYSMPTLQNLPDNAYFHNITQGLKPGPNAEFMVSNGLKAWGVYSDLFSAALATALAPTPPPMLFSLQNEFSFRGDAWPFNTVGEVVTTSGVFEFEPFFLTPNRSLHPRSHAYFC